MYDEIYTHIIVPIGGYAFSQEENGAVPQVNVLVYWKNDTSHHKKYAIQHILFQGCLKKSKISWHSFSKPTHAFSLVVGYHTSV